MKKVEGGKQTLRLKNMGFSVLMSVYNGDSSPFFATALESIFLQDLMPNEIVVVCDGPIRADLEDILREYRLKFKGVGVVFLNPRLNENKGLGEALRLGTSYCSFDYIIRMDSDDISISSRLSTLSSYVINNPEVDVVGSYIEEFTKEPGDLNRMRVVGLDLMAITQSAHKRNPMNHVTVCIKKSALEESGGYEAVLWHEDYYLWMKMLKQGCLLENIPEALVLVRTNDFAGRRIGMTYVRAELNFLGKCKELGVMSNIQMLAYIIPRMIVRILPPFIVTHLYSLLRVK